jgi:retron-type reverse transcriptase
MKRYGNLFEKIIDIDNLKLAHKNARKGKTYYKDVKMVDSDPDRFLWQLHDSLKNKTFKTSPYVTKQIYEPKSRTIYKLPYFPDRIVHHAIMNVLQPIWDRTFIYDLYSAIPGKGIHAGSYRLRQFMRDKENTRYCLKFDVSKFYPSINHDILMEKIHKKIKCKDTLWLLEEIVRSPGGNTNAPIGNYLSQYFSNLYLSDFDHWVKEEKQMRYYIRYCDDGVILHRSREVLKDLQAEINEYLQEKLNLTLNPKTRIINVDKQGIDFLGYRCFRNCVLLRKRSALNFKRKIRYIENHTVAPSFVLCSVMSSIGWLKHSDSHNLLKKFIFNNHTIIQKVSSASHSLQSKNPLSKYTEGKNARIYNLSARN